MHGTIYFCVEFADSRNDITLLKLETDLEFDVNVDKIEVLPTKIFSFSSAIATGYGYLYEGICL